MGTVLVKTNSELHDDLVIGDPCAVIGDTVDNTWLIGSRDYIDVIIQRDTVLVPSCRKEK